MTTLESVSLRAVDIRSQELSYSTHPKTIQLLNKDCIPYPFFLSICNISLASHHQAECFPQFSGLVSLVLGVVPSLNPLSFHIIQHYFSQLFLTQSNESKKQSKEKQPG